MSRNWQRKSFFFATCTMHIVDSYCVPLPAPISTAWKRIAWMQTAWPLHFWRPSSPKRQKEWQNCTHFQLNERNGHKISKSQRKVCRCSSPRKPYSLTQCLSFKFFLWGMRGDRLCYSIWKLSLLPWFLFSSLAHTHTSKSVRLSASSMSSLLKQLPLFACTSCYCHFCEIHIPRMTWDAAVYSSHVNAARAIRDDVWVPKWWQQCIWSSKSVRAWAVSECESYLHFLHTAHSTLYHSNGWWFLCHFLFVSIPFDGGWRCAVCLACTRRNICCWKLWWNFHVKIENFVTIHSWDKRFTLCHLLLPLALGARRSLTRPHHPSIVLGR